MKADYIRLRDFSTPPMRAFHMAWAAFFLCFFAWFGVAPLMPVVRQELGLTPVQVADAAIASVAMTIVARLLVGWCCDRFGPRRVYAWLLVIGALPVLAMALVTNYWQFLVVRLAIGAIGASFVVTQCHTSAMFAPRVVGAANATAAGWGNLGGGVAQMAMPLFMAGFLALGSSRAGAWRLAMTVPALAMWVAAWAYLRFTQDTPAGNVGEPGVVFESKKKGSFLAAFVDVRVGSLAIVYGACFGIELTIHNVAALYFHDRFHLGVGAAGLIAGSFGALALFARALGGYLGDRAGERWQLRGRARLLGLLLAAEGVGLAWFSQMNSVVWAVIALVSFGLFVHMSAGATYAVVPFVRKDSIGAVSGIVGAGGNIGAVLAGLVIRNQNVPLQTSLLWLGLSVLATSTLTLVLGAGRGADERELSVSEEAAVPASMSHPTAVGEAVVGSVAVP